VVVTLIDLIGLWFVFVFLILMIVFAAGVIKVRRGDLREIPAFLRLRQAVGRSVEAGTRIHLTIGAGNLLGVQSAIAFLSLRVLEHIGNNASVSDRPPVATAGEGALVILSQDTLRKTSNTADVPFDPTSGRLTGITPFPYALGTLPIIYDEGVATNVLFGNFGAESAFISDAGERTGSLTVAGTDNLPGQAILYASAQEPLIGEEAFAAGAYLEAGAIHSASLRAQDVTRWVIIVVIIGGALLKLVGVL
jgi:hypothetical protein